jgi:hypothetical protein
MPLSPGRASDIQTLEKLHRDAKSPQERNKWANKIRIIRSESQNKSVMHLRTKLIAAHKKNDAAEAESIGEELYRITRNK